MTSGRGPHSRLRRCDLGYVHRDNPGLVKRHLDELLAESWQLARDEAIGSMAKLDSARGTPTLCPIIADPSR